MLISLAAVFSGSVAVASMMVWNLCRPKRSKDAPSLTATQRRLVVSKPNQDLRKVQISVQADAPIPVPKHGQVLVKVLAVPIHPSVFNEWKSPKAHGKSFGNEGAGIVVASGGGFLAGLLVGKKVGLVASDRTEATASDYVVVDAMRSAWSFPSSAHIMDAAAWFINPVTVLSMLDTTQKHKSKALLHTGASSQLGQMLVHLAPRQGLTTLNVVRRQEHVEMLKELGAQHVVCQADADWKEQLQTKITELNVKVAFDAVAGDMTGQIVSMLPRKGICYVYGVLSGDPVGQIDPIDLIYRRKQVKGYMNLNWILQAPLGPLGILWRMRSCVQRIAPALKEGGWACSQFHDCSMEGLEKEFTTLYEQGFTGRKLRVRMDI